MNEWVKKMLRIGLRGEGKITITISTHCVSFVGTSFVHLAIKACAGLVKNKRLGVWDESKAVLKGGRKHRNILLRLFDYAIVHPTGSCNERKCSWQQKKEEKKRKSQSRKKGLSPHGRKLNESFPNEKN